MKTIQKKVNELNPAVYNPRKISPKQMKDLMESIQEFGFVEPVIINIYPGRENTIISGHQRLKAAKSLAFTEVPCVTVSLDEQREKELNVRMNKSGGEFDMDIMLDFFTKDELMAWGFGEKELKEFNEATGKDMTEEIPEPPKIPITQPGDLYEFETENKHRLICGDSTLPEVYEKLMTKKAHLVVTDPPYNVDYEGGTGLKIENDKMSDSRFFNFLHDAFFNFQTHLKPGGCYYIFHADSEGLNFRSAVNKTGLLMKQCLIWVKQAAVMGRQDYNWKHEPILYGWKAGAAHYFIGDFTSTTVLDKIKNFKSMTKDQLVKILKDIEANKNESIIRIDRPSKNELHPTIKPVALIAKLIINSSERKQTVLDPFSGSGTTLLAAEITNRNCNTIELGPGYCDVNIIRFVNYMTEKQLPYKIKRNGFLLTQDEINSFLN